jgi:very-short-patch-repair endonuclease
MIRAWNVIPSPEQLQSEMLDVLARLALGIWPAWYGCAAAEIEQNPSLMVSALWQQAVAQSVASQVDRNWLRQAVEKCRDGQLPRNDNFTASYEAQQLALVARPQRSILVLSATDLEQPPHGWLGFARLAEWLATHGQSAVLLVLPSAAINFPELDSTNYGALQLAAVAPPTLQPVGEQENSERATVRERNVREWLATPLVGRPHPYSQGENLICERLSNAPKLRGLFEFNQRIERNSGGCYLVDLLWRAGKLIVEIDGYYWHSSPQAFSRDRRRDFELMLLGYRVLRLPHDEVVVDVDEALGRIYAMVEFCRKKPDNAS